MTADVLTTIYELKDEYSATCNQITAATKRAQTAIGGGKAGGGGGGNGASGAVDAFADSFRFAARELDSATPILQEVVAVLKGVAGVAVGAGVALVAFTGYAMNVGATFESLQLGLAAYSGSVEETEKNMRRLREVARMPGLGVDEAISASTALQAAGFNARLAERALLGFGNALASVGKGKDDLEGVMTALTQIASKGVVSAEEINQIAERVPQIRKLMMTAFGTASTEDLAKKGVTSRDFTLKIIDALDTLPQAATGARNSMDNLWDNFTSGVAQLGQAVNRDLMPSFDAVGNFTDYLGTIDFFKGIEEKWSASAGKMGRSLQATGKAWAANLFQASASESVNGNDAASSAFGSAGDMVNFLASGKDLADTMVRGFAFVAAVVENFPSVLDAVLSMIQDNATGLTDVVNKILKAIQAVWKGLGMDIDIRGVRVGGVKGTVAGLGATIEGPSFQSSPETQKKLAELGQGVFGRAEELYNGSKAFVPSSEVANDKSKGDLLMDQQATALYNIEKNTSRSADALEKSLYGSIVGNSRYTKADAASVRGGRGRNKAEQLGRMLIDIMGDASLGVAVSTSRATIQR